MARPAAAPRPAKRAAALWLGLYLPALPLETAAVAEEGALYAVFEERHGVREVLQASAAALQAGVRPGLSVNAALALLPELRLAERDPAAESGALGALAAWAGRYTSFVVTEAPDLLLLEIARSLRLFGGLRPLRQRLVRELAGQGYTAKPAIAPTPLAATWLARAGRRQSVSDNRRLADVLGRLPLSCLAWPEKVTAALGGMGIECIGELLRLPRDGFAKRFGSARLAELDRALGRLPDPRRHFQQAAAFAAERDLDGEESDRDRLLEHCDGLLQALETFLLTRQLAVQRLRFRFWHLRQPATRLTVGGLQPERRHAHWRALLGIRLEQLELPAPVIGIDLEATDPGPLVAHSGLLGFAGERQAPSIAPLLERLGARIGDEAVHGIGNRPEHRPDRAWSRQPALAPMPCCAAMPAAERPAWLADMQQTDRLLLRRPLWVLEQPEQLACRDGQPCYPGPLTLESGPERIETGWWDEAGVARDYYVACTVAGHRSWVFQDRRTRRWYLQGLFG